MAQPNYGFAKRQREFAKKQKKEEEKRLRKQAEQSVPPGESSISEPGVAPEKGETPQD
jgi:hypothetical protein